MGSTQTVSREELKVQFDALHAEYVQHMENLKRNWLLLNNTIHNHPDCYEVMRDKDRAEVDGILRSFDVYITPIAEKWWKDRGWTIQWPANNSDPCQYTKD